ncbi:SDR family NAD(P)-dependent oxidoreductase [Nocardioides pantholopis]|uniref:SDR family NAD(P)-dependent oxidoreductase n=1 Tax=Nocardioides pantholopis TaxID=2483798 RepID=UPI000FDB9135|nr:SDR family oxidoreductase [Nocardioides pantholopis]
MLLENKVAIVHGGGGALGGAAARVFAREGAEVHLVGRTPGPLDAVADDIEAAGGRASTAVLDAFEPEPVREHVARVVRGSGRVDVALNAVGVPHLQGPPLEEVSLPQFLRPIEGYLRTNFVTAQAVAEPMRAQGAGVVLTLSTPGSQLPGTGYLGYAAACGAVEAFSRVLAGELGRDGIRVVCLRPNAIPESVATSHVGEVFAPVAERAGTDVPGWLAAMADQATLLGRLPTLADVAEYAAFVASDRAGAMTAAIANLTCGTLAD